MKILILFSSIFLIISLAYFLVSCKSKVSQSESSNEGVSKKTVTENPYNGLRSMAFDVDPKKLGLEMPDNQEKIYGVIMDIDMGQAIVTQVTFVTGDASLYFSSGGGVIGAGQHESVSKIVKLFVAKSQDYLSKAKETTLTPVAEKGMVNFYFLTNKKKYKITEEMSKINDETSPFLSLFYDANEVLTQIRMTEQSKTRN